jgi:hypothetical protein
VQGRAVRPGCAQIFKELKNPYYLSIGGVSLHVNKGIAGGPAEAIAAARDTAINPAVLDAFALITGTRRGHRRIPALLVTSLTCRLLANIGCDRYSNE